MKSAGQKIYLTELESFSIQYTKYVQDDRTKQKLLNQTFKKNGIRYNYDQLHTMIYILIQVTS